MKEASNLNYSDKNNPTVIKLADYSPIVNLAILEEKLDSMPDEYKTLEYLETVRTQCKAGAHFCKLEIKKRKKLRKYIKEYNLPALQSQPVQTKDEPRPTIVNINAPVDQVTVAGNIDAENYKQKD